MKHKIIAENKKHLEELIKQEINMNGNECDLNHIDVSKINQMIGLFQDSKFNGDISEWDVSNVTDMSGMFSNATFNGDLSKWNVSKVEDMNFMFIGSAFKQNISEWKPYCLESFISMFTGGDLPIPYWIIIENKEKRGLAIDNYWLKKELDNNLINNNDNNTKKPKI
jgi:surface protein